MNEITRTGWDVLDEARAMLRAAVAGVPADGWQRPTPCTEWNVAQVLQHAALDQGAWAAVISGTQPLPSGPMPPADAAGAAALDAAIHAWDIAMATGQGSPLTPDLARALTPVAKSIVEPLRQYGVYAAEIETPAGADDAAALLCYLGRSPV